MARIVKRWTETTPTGKVLHWEQDDTGMAWTKELLFPTDLIRSAPPAQASRKRRAPAPRKAPRRVAAPRRAPRKASRKTSAPSKRARRRCIRWGRSKGRRVCRKYTKSRRA